MSRYNEKHGPFSLFAMLAVFCLLIGGCFMQQTNVQYRSVKVTGKEIARGKSSSRREIYTDSGTYVVGDSFFYGTFDAADIYGKIEPGEKYRLKTRGYRIPFFSMFPTVIAADKESSSEANVEK